ncbi:xylose isomerase [Candidatus Desantisbacteria bacterium CG_4_10_14_0_8_um_filter_48_22]|uniref:Xylose isomerase n=1 Tax=Candidatus Desantisbacteria bacterium CG_4_10_14_0_8_um_filter_48_22 TaxID=1974543 RepID=A0A2M7S626_9BACT|nr:MAG: xylose isomerase [Candidatus Desantisbacteria bacterium CG1_02_49_89]PIV56646.1 MAG: xylose isomerase [Candidatus Desantisbacteria bacterium CG02_land_8_20_14_3_00_49_13]PIZ14995.1 MAG: xylose isomerase [Candidatus Desantisbacteria bacterium CG_4_10_14_0_8_um_filter_48_22]
MRLGGPLFVEYSNPEGWVAAVMKYHGYSAAFCPLGTDQLKNTSLVRNYEEAAKKADIVIAEMGAWSNPMSPDEKIRSEALKKCKESLALADEIGARCCVNIAGSRGQKWDGPCQEDLTDQTFEMIVDTVRGIIDDVKPRRAFYALETMQWMYPDSAECYIKLIRAIGRKQFGVHMDPVNLICSPQRYFGNAAVIRDCFKKLGPYIRSCHGKDIMLADRSTVHLDEVRPGTGGLDYGVFLQELAKLHPDTPLMLEHLAKEEEYAQAAEYVRSVAVQKSVKII